MKKGVLIRLFLVLFIIIFYLLFFIKKYIPGSVAYFVLLLLTPPNMKNKQGMKLGSTILLHFMKENDLFYPCHW